MSPDPPPPEEALTRDLPLPENGPEPVGAGEDQALEHLADAVESPGRYREIREYGRGGLGRVLVVNDVLLARDIALKELTPQASPDVETLADDVPWLPSDSTALRFLREARITGQLEHPAIVPVHELGRRRDGTLYYTMKLVRGHTLEQAIAGAGSLHRRLALLAHFQDLCQAIAYSHSRGVIHRDIKPSNVMIGEFGETVVIDWGLAKVKGAQEAPATPTEGKEAHQACDEDAAGLTRYGHLLGTPHYMPPEQALGDTDAIDERSDVYALGAVLYELLTGRRPFTGASAEDIANRVVHGNPTPVTALEPNAPAELVAICVRAMQKTPQARYRSAKELAAEIERFQTGSLVAAYHYSKNERLKRFIQAHKLGLGATASVLLVLAISIAVSMTAILKEKARTEQEFYSASISWAKSAIENRRLREARDALMNTPEKRRHCEWGLLLNLSYPDLMALRGHTDRIAWASFSPDGTQLATASDDDSAKVWDVRTGDEIMTLQGEQGNVERVAYSADGQLLATSHTGGSTMLWDVGTGRRLLEVEGDAVAFSPDGKCIATASGLGSWATLYDSGTGAERCRLEGHTDDILHVAFDSDGKRIATASRDRTIRIWEAASGKPVHELTGHTGAVRCVAFSAHGEYIASASDDNSTRLWDSRAGEEVRCFEGHTGIVWCVCFCPCGDFIATSSEDRTIRVWEVASGRQIRQLDGFPNPPRFATMAPRRRTGCDRGRERRTSRPCPRLHGEVLGSHRTHRPHQCPRLQSRQHTLGYGRRRPQVLQRRPRHTLGRRNGTRPPRVQGA